MKNHLETLKASLHELINLSMDKSNHSTEHLFELTHDSDESFNRLALNLFSFQFQYNLPYQQFCKRRKKTPFTVRSWMDIPAVPISAFKEAALGVMPVEEAQAVFMTSGTTRQEQKGKNLHGDLEIYDLSMKTHFKKYMLPDQDRIRMYTLFPSEVTWPHSSLAHYLSLAIQEFGDEQSQCVFDGDQLNSGRLIDHLKHAESSGTPVFLLGATFSFVHFLDECGRQGISFRLPEGSRVMDTGGIKNRSRQVDTEEFRHLAAEVFGLPLTTIGNMYGMTELSSEFYDDYIRKTFIGEVSSGVAAEGTGAKIPPHWVRTRVVHPETLQDMPIGEKGIIVHYDLANLYSVLAIMTEDVGVRLQHGFKLLGRAEGAEARGCSLAVEEFMRATERRV
jgi:hypothetical protein